MEERTDSEVVNRIVNEFSAKFNFIPEFEYIRTDQSGREIYIHKISEENIGIFQKFIQNAKIILKIKKFIKDEKPLRNFDFSYEFFTLSNSRQGFPASYFVYDEKNDSFKEYKN